MGRHKGKQNVTCISCKRDFHCPPSKIGKLIRCPDCRVNQQGVGEEGKKYSNICPICNKEKSLVSEICQACFNDVMSYSKEVIMSKICDSGDSGNV